MKWRTKEHGDTRTRTFFALVPYNCDDGTTRWLERITVTEKYEDSWTEGFWVPVSCMPANPISGQP